MITIEYTEKKTKKRKIIHTNLTYPQINIFGLAINHLTDGHGKNFI